MLSFFAVDPGLSGAGLVYFEGDVLSFGTNIYPKGKTWIDKGEDLFDKILEFIVWVNKTDALVCEIPTFMVGDKGVAALEDGKLVKLAWGVGVIAGVAYSREIPFIPVGVNEWKGQLPKEVVNNRLESYYGVDVLSKKGVCNHAFDALGIGLYYLGIRMDQI